MLANVARRALPAPVQAPLLAAVRWRRLRAVNRVMRDGFPDVFVEPVRSLAGKRVPDAALPVYEKVEGIRAQLARRTRETVRFPNGFTRTLDGVASYVSIAPAYGVFLHLCAAAIEADTVLELGVGGGIGACYLALVPSVRQYVGIDLAPQGLAIARGNLGQCVADSRVRLMQTSFAAGIEQLASESATFSFVWLDGDHYPDRVLGYFESLVPLLKPGSIIAFDDIRWSLGMLDAWEQLQDWPGFSCTLDLGRVGMGVWTGGDQRPSSWDFSRELLWPWRLNRSTLPVTGVDATM
jgi:predicted O-methyltransferase YrrM